MCQSFLLSMPKYAHQLGSKNFFSADFPFGGTCFNSVTEASASGNGRRGIGEPFYAYEARGSGQLGSNISSNHDLNVPAYAVIEKRSSTSRKRSTSDTIVVQHPTTSWAADNANKNRSDILDRRAIPFLPGYLVCPTVDNEISGSSGATDCLCYSDNNIDVNGATGESPGMSLIFKISNR